MQVRVTYAFKGRTVKGTTAQTGTKYVQAPTFAAAKEIVREWLNGKGRIVAVEFKSVGGYATRQDALDMATSLGLLNAQGLAAKGVKEVVVKDDRYMPGCYTFTAVGR
jgi:hypothetical protein